VNQQARTLALLLVLASSLLSPPAIAERVVFRNGRSTAVSKPPCISGEKVILEIEDLPTPIAYDRNLIDEAKTFHANPQTPLAKLFGPCPVIGVVASGVTADPSAAAPQPAAAIPLRAYSLPSSSSSGGSTNQSTSSRCAATTKKGTQCSRRAQPGRAYCYQH